jgi:hypothetical protein
MPQRKRHTPGCLFQVRRAGKGGKRLCGDDAFDLRALVAFDIRFIACSPVAWVLQSPIETALAVLVEKQPLLTPKLLSLHIVHREQPVLFEAAQ